MQREDHFSRTAIRLGLLVMDSETRDIIKIAIAADPQINLVQEMESYEQLMTDIEQLRIDMLLFDVDAFGLTSFREAIKGIRQYLPGIRLIVLKDTPSLDLVLMSLASSLQGCMSKQSLNTSVLARNIPKAMNRNAFVATPDISNILAKVISRREK